MLSSSIYAFAGNSGAQNQLVEQSGGGITRFKGSLMEANLSNPDEVAKLQLYLPPDAKVGCGLDVSWGDGTVDVVRLHSEHPTVAEHKYQKPGIYAVYADGKAIFKGLDSVFACSGDKQVWAVNVITKQQSNEIQEVQTSEESAVTSQSPEKPIKTNGEKRVALLIGNSKYTFGMPPLLSPERDVEVLAASLNRLNFDVQVLKDLNLSGIRTAARNFGTRAKGAKIAFFYYSGHGMQSHDENYLIPVAGKIEKEADLEIEAFSLKGLMRQIEDAHPKTTIAVLDAGGDNPIAGSTKGFRIVSKVSAPPPNTLIIYSTLSGSTTQSNNIFATELANQLMKPNLGIRTIFDKVNAAMKQQVVGGHGIERSDLLSEDIILYPTQVSVANNTGNLTTNGTDADTETWLAAKTVNTYASYNAYLQAYPNGKYAGAAKIARTGKQNGSN